MPFMGQRIGLVLERRAKGRRCSFVGYMAEVRAQRSPVAGVDVQPGALHCYARRDSCQHCTAVNTGSVAQGDTCGHAAAATGQQHLCGWSTMSLPVRILSMQ